MRHWFLLLTHSRSRPLPVLGANNFVYGSDSLTQSLSPQERLKMSVLGTIESIPTFGAALAAHKAGSDGLATAIVLAGLGFSALLCWVLCRHTPLTPIHAKPRPNPVSSQLP